MTRKDRYKEFIKYFSKHQPEPTTELKYNNHFQLLVAVILSARCTDKRINMVTPALFKAFPKPKDMAYRNFQDVYQYIKSVTFPNNKTKYLIEMSKTLVEDFNGKVPKEAKDLEKLSGVGRKTAHVLSSVLHGQPTMAVDTHVFRVSKRIGLVDEDLKTPLAVEKQLVQNIEEKYIHKAHHWLILHGRYICVARKPKCDKCPLTHFCLYFKNNKV